MPAQVCKELSFECLLMKWDLLLLVCRCCFCLQVWYEWALSSATAVTHIHNPNGRSYYVGL